MKHPTAQDAARALADRLIEISRDGYTVTGLDPAKVRIVPDSEAGPAVGAKVKPRPSAPAAAANGNVCPECGAQTQQAGTCEVCTQCGATTGCG